MYNQAKYFYQHAFFFKSKHEVFILNSTKCSFTFLTVDVWCIINSRRSIEEVLLATKKQMKVSDLKSKMCSEPKHDCKSRLREEIYKVENKR